MIKMRKGVFRLVSGKLKQTLSLLSIFAILGFAIVPAPAFAGSEDASAPVASAAEAKTEKETEKAKAKADTPQVSVSVRGDGLSVKWKRLKGARSYSVYRSYRRSSGWKLLKSGVIGRSYTDRTVESGRKAYYKVLAIKAKGKKSHYSEAVSGIIYRVYIETGHGTDIKNIWDSGCIWNGYQEARLVIPVCKATAKHLRSKGVYVYTDAFSGNNRNLKWTIRHVKSHDVSVLLNIHCDYRYAPSGTMPLYRYEDQKELARCLNKGVHKYVKIRDRGLVKRTDLDTLNNTRGYCVACLFETGSIKYDNKLLRTQYNAYGKGLAKGICDYLGIE